MQFLLYTQFCSHLNVQIACNVPNVLAIDNNLSFKINLIVFVINMLLLKVIYN